VYGAGLMTKDYATKDSGHRRDFPSGARRDMAEGKGRYDLLLPESIDREAKLFERGAKKYGDNNYQKGIPSSVFMDSLLRHAFKYRRGMRDEDHPAAIRWNASGLIFNEERMPEMNDLEIERPEAWTFKFHPMNYILIGFLIGIIVTALAIGLTGCSFPNPRNTISFGEEVPYPEEPKWKPAPTNEVYNPVIGICDKHGPIGAWDDYVITNRMMRCGKCNDYIW
jgi:hypothetical protein